MAQTAQSDILDRVGSPPPGCPRSARSAWSSGTRLDVSEDMVAPDPEDPTAPEYALYELLVSAPVPDDRGAGRRAARRGSARGGAVIPLLISKSPDPGLEPPSSSGLGRRPFKAVTRVRIPLGVRCLPSASAGWGPVVQFGVHAGLSSRRSRVQIPSGPPPRSAETRSGSSVGRARAEKREVTGSTPVPTTRTVPVRTSKIRSVPSGRSGSPIFADCSDSVRCRR